ncbi:hypothetical protein LINPERHAP1_LOCUS4040 [Linum perenne]
MKSSPGPTPDQASSSGTPPSSQIEHLGSVADEQILRSGICDGDRRGIWVGMEIMEIDEGGRLERSGWEGGEGGEVG